MSSYDDRSPGSTGRLRSSDYHYDDPDRDGTYSDTAVLDRDGRNGRDQDTDRYGVAGGAGGADGTGFTSDTAVERRPFAWNSGADLGLLVMRLVVGAIFMAHGAQKVFGWFGGPGLDGFAEDLDGMGYSPADVLAALTGFTELVGGALVVLGLFTPLAAAGLLGVMVNVIWVKWPDGLFTADGGYELELALAALAAGLVLAGPGRVALDNGRVWFRHPVVTGWLCLLIAAGAAVGVRFLFHS